MDCIECEDPKQIPNAVRSSVTSYKIGGIVRYTCNPGFVMGGDGTITCQENGQWSPVPVCVLRGKTVLLLEEKELPLGRMCTVYTA